MTADDRYSLLIRGNVLQHFQIQLCQNQKIFSEFFLTFSKFRLNFEHFQKKRWPSKLTYLWIYRLRKTWLDKRLKSLVLEETSTSDMVNKPKHCVNLNNSTFTIIYWPQRRQLRWKKYLWVISKILKLFVNPLTADDKCSLLNRDNL